MHSTRFNPQHLQITLPYQKCLYNWQCFYVLDPENPREGKAAKLNRSKITCTSKINNLMAGNINGFTGRVGRHTCICQHGQWSDRIMIDVAYVIMLFSASCCCQCTLLKHQNIYFLRNSLPFKSVVIYWYPEILPEWVTWLAHSLCQTISFTEVISETVTGQFLSTVVKEMDWPSDCWLSLPIFSQTIH